MFLSPSCCARRSAVSPQIVSRHKEAQTRCESRVSVTPARGLSSRRRDFTKK
jgi:hypothetical protein